MKNGFYFSRKIDIRFMDVVGVGGGWHGMACFIWIASE